METTYYHPRENPADEDSKEVDASFENFVGYKNRNRAVWLRGENHRLVGATLADNGIGATFASYESFLEDSLVVGETANKGTPEQWEVDQNLVGRDGRSLPVLGSRLPHPRLRVLRRARRYPKHHVRELQVQPPA